MTETLDVTATLRIPLDEFRFRFARSSGPGGQNVNKVSSKATLVWPLATSPSLPEPVRRRFLARYPRRMTVEGELVITSQRYRDQRRNIDDCIQKLREMLLEVARPPTKRRRTKPTSSSIERRLTEKRVRGQKKARRRPADREG